jgi:hypothetical protein
LSRVVSRRLSLRHQAEGNWADGEQGEHPLHPNRTNDLKAGREHHGSLIAVAKADFAASAGRLFDCRFA